jgi:predicted nucleic acid-binding protein
LRILNDTNILVRLRDATDPRHSVCTQALHRLRASGNELFVCAQVMIEYWVVATRPRNVNGLGLEPADAVVNLQDFEQLFVLLSEPPDMAVRWRALASQHVVRGRQAHDTRLVALMLAHGVTHLLTLNGADFARYTGITCIAPEDV